jgi:hypothetical protein
MKNTFWDSLFEPTPKQVKRIQKAVIFVGGISTIASTYSQLNTPSFITAIIGFTTTAFSLYLQTFTKEENDTSQK